MKESKLMELNFPTFYQEIINKYKGAVNQVEAVRILFEGEKERECTVLTSTKVSNYVTGKKPLPKHLITAIEDIDDNELSKRMKKLGIQDMGACATKTKDYLKNTLLTAKAKKELMSHYDEEEPTMFLCAVFRVALKWNPQSLSEQTKIKKGSVKHEQSKKQDEVNKMIDELHVKASTLYDQRDYAAGLSKANEAINVCKSNKTINAALLLKSYNLKLINAIQLASEEDSYQGASELLKLIPDNLDDEKKVLYYGNCALGFLQANENEEGEKCALKALEVAKRIEKDDLHYYYSLYSACLFRTLKLTDAYKYAKEAIDLYLKSAATDEMTTELIKYRCNLAEVAMASCEKEQKKVKKRPFLMEARDNVCMVVTQIEEANLTDNQKKDAYELVIEVFKMLANHYS